MVREVTPSSPATRVEILRGLSDDLARGDRCLAWAEGQRRRYEDNQRNHQNTQVRLARLRLGVQFTTQDYEVAMTQGSADWGRTTMAADMKATGLMFGQWADNYYARHAAFMAGEQVRLLRLQTGIF